MRSRLVVVSLGIWCASRVAGCYGATEYTLELSTDVKCTYFRGLTITTGRLRDIETDAPATASAVCDPRGKLGTLVVVPSGARDESAYIGAVDKVYAVNPDGTIKWTHATGGVVNAMPAIASDGTIIVGAEDDKLYAIRPDGRLRWQVDASVGAAFNGSQSTGGASAAIDATGAVYVAGGPGKFSAFAADGTRLWELANGGCPTCRFGSAAIGSDGTIYAPADKLYALAP